MLWNMKLGIFTLHTRKCSSIYSKTCVFWVKRQQHASSIIFLQWCIAASIRFGTKSTTTTYLHSATRAFICPVRNEKEISIKMLSLLVCWGGKEQKWRHHGVHSTLLESALWKYQENSFCYGTECRTFDHRRQKEDRWRSADWKMQVVEPLTEIE